MTALSSLLATRGPALAAAPGVATPPGVVVSAAPARERPGFTASFGLGSAYGVLGLQVRYDRPLRPWLHLAPFLGGGTNTESGWSSLVGSVGLSAGLGWRHRLTADFVLAPVVWNELNLHGTEVDLRTIYGPHLAAGYEHASDSGAFQRVLVGYGWGEWGKGAGPFPSEQTLTVGFGWRVW